MPRVFKLTQRTVEALTCPPGRKDMLIFDGELRGFGVRVTAAGSRVFLVQYPGPGGKRRLRLGPFGALTVEEARRAAKVALGDVARGADPVADRQAAAAAAEAARREDAYTFEVMIRDWSEARAGDRRTSYIDEAIGCLRRNLPGWLTRPAAQVTLQDAIVALDDIKARKGIVAANRTLAYARAAYGWAGRRQQVPTNPLKGIERPGREIARDRVLGRDELALIWAAIETLSPTRGAFVRVLLLTLQRLGEVQGMQWAELDRPDDPTLWMLPAARAKNGKAHVVHLAEPVRTLLRDLPAIKGNPYVFAGTGRQPIDGDAHTKDQITAALTRTGIALPDWRFHDFRRTGVTALAGMGFGPHVCDRILNHLTGSIQGVAAVYQRHEFTEERTKALDAWAGYVTTAARDRQAESNAVDFERIPS